ncbi:unnamed protein product [Oppiella nova]|uniref:LNS2/PITP domain-containing protein n=1 Tax=Oppiella nova TaxID=334625 RepID=A0A7R9LQQ5_9ACAR|nr:unnamed protein product [Oppiella nova]CAG2166047.1 unnamed protein product [Oppiella nova]
MNYMKSFFSNFREFYNEINSATLTGAIDVIVVQQEDGSYKCSPFYVRFGKIGVLRSREKIVDIEVNGQPVDLHMKLGHSGDAFFFEEIIEEEPKNTRESAPSPTEDTENGWLSDTYLSSGSDAGSDADIDENSQPNGETKEPNEQKDRKQKIKYKKKIRLSSQQIDDLNLNEGKNEVVFSVTTAYQGTTTCKCYIYLWRYDDQIIISDIDGTITKSDVLGHILPIIGRDWAQSGVANLFTLIKKNGYKIVYLSARAIGQSSSTGDYLKSIRQGDRSLPEGPLLLSPTSMIAALHREVIEKKPEEFKIQCLQDIRDLYPSSRSPFYAGFGNKINDTWAYRAVEIRPSRIFMINHKGELKLELIQNFQSSYTSLSDLVDQMFPPLHSDQTDFSSEYSAFEYWRESIPDIDDGDDLLISLQTKVNLSPKLVNNKNDSIFRKKVK